MKTNKNLLIPVKRILNVINSCQDETQIQNCKVLIHNYVKSAKKNGVLNINELTSRLNDELIQRQEALYLVKMFDKNI
jgi:hypothetical protein